MPSIPHDWRFGEAPRLFLLAAVLAVAVAYVVLQSRRAAYETRLSDVDLLESVMPRRPGWRRHLPAALLVLTLVALTTGFAKPSANVKTTRDKATIIVALDVSSSMKAVDVNPSRIVAAQAAAQAFVKGLRPGFSVGLVAFNGIATLIVPPTLEKQAVATALANLQLSGGTAIGDAVGISVRAAQAVRAKGDTAPVRIVLLSDGGNTVGQSVEDGAQQALQAQMPVTTIAYGSPNGFINGPQGEVIPVPVDRETLAALSRTTGGQTYTALTRKELRSVYASIAKEVGTTTKRQDLTGAMTGLGLLLGLCAAAASLVWFRVLP